MEDKYLVGIDEYKVLNDKDPIGYTRDINSCIGLLLHRKESTIIMHIEAYEKNIELDNLFELLKDKKNPVLKAEIFQGPNTAKGNLSILYFLFARLGIYHEFYKAFKSVSNEISLGYNYNTKEYLGVSMDRGKPIFSRRRLRK